jgi:1,3-beta-glucan synthase
MKQTKLRRRRVIRYAVLYFVLLVVFLALIVGPSVAGKYVPDSMFNMLKDFKLVQPTGLDNNDTRGTSATGTDNPSHTIHNTKSTTVRSAARATGMLDSRAFI